MTAESEEGPSHTAIDLGPVSVDQLGAYVSRLHANGNQIFKKNYEVSSRANHVGRLYYVCITVGFGQWRERSQGHCGKDPR